MRPARSINLCEMVSASLGTSRSVGMKVLLGSHLFPKPEAQAYQILVGRIDEYHQHQRQPDRMSDLHRLSVYGTAKNALNGVKQNIDLRLKRGIGKRLEPKPPWR